MIVEWSLVLILVGYNDGGVAIDHIDQFHTKEKCELAARQISQLKSSVKELKTVCIKK